MINLLLDFKTIDQNSFEGSHDQIDSLNAPEAANGGVLLKYIYFLILQFF